MTEQEAGANRPGLFCFRRPWLTGGPDEARDRSGHANGERLGRLQRRQLGALRIDASYSDRVNALMQSGPCGARAPRPRSTAYARRARPIASLGGSRTSAFDSLCAPYPSLHPPRDAGPPRSAIMTSVRPTWPRFGSDSSAPLPVRSPLEGISYLDSAVPLFTASSLSGLSPNRMD